jgi:hypothetical protein
LASTDLPDSVKNDKIYKCTNETVSTKQNTVKPVLTTTSEQKTPVKNDQPESTTQLKQYLETGISRSFD